MIIHYFAGANHQHDDSSGISSCTTMSSTEHPHNPTHRAQSMFVPRHDDELLLEIGDAVHVERECEDHWSIGKNISKIVPVDFFQLKDEFLSDFHAANETLRKPCINN
jgi:hypothetical protein